MSDMTVDALTEAREKLEIALGALADIASNTDMTLDQMQAKANRIYWELRGDEDPADNTSPK